MPKVTLKIDHKGIAELLKSAQMRKMVDEAAGKIAGEVRSKVAADVPVAVEPYTTDRAAAAVVITDARGMVYQAQGGVLTKAAAAIGADVKAKP